MLHVFCAPEISRSCATYVLKRTRSNGAAKSQQLGLAREFKFYEHTKAAAGTDALAPLAAYLPQIVYSGGSMESGLKDILMQDLTSAVQSGYFFGPFSPHNWNKDLAALMRGWDAEAGLDAASVTALAFTAAASVHAPLWNKHDDLQHLPWLKCVHIDRALWLESQQQAASAWAAERARPVGSIEWHPLLVACLDASLSRARAEAGGWEAFQAELKTRPLTLVHGDFHPGNMMIAREAAGCRLFLLDWEVVGVGSGPQELGQCACHSAYVNQSDTLCRYLISHASPQTREKIWREAVEGYYARLLALNPSVADSMTLDGCVAEYVSGGAGRWFWFLPILAAMCPPKMTQFFHDQVLAFVQYHNITPETSPMPRV